MLAPGEGAGVLRGGGGGGQRERERVVVVVVGGVHTVVSLDTKF